MPERRIALEGDEDGEREVLLAEELKLAAAAIARQGPPLRGSLRKEKCTPRGAGAMTKESSIMKVFVPAAQVYGSNSFDMFSRYRKEVLRSSTLTNYLLRKFSQSGIGR